jgi:hypothetical protein
VLAPDWQAAAPNTDVEADPPFAPEVAMDAAHLMNAVVAIRPRLADLSADAGKSWLAAGLLLNGMLVGVTAIGSLTTREQLDRLSGEHSASVAQQTQGLKAVESRLVDVRRAVSSHAREEALFLKMLILKPGLDLPLARRMAAAIQANCVLYGQDPNLVLSIIAIESGFNPSASSPAGAVGLMQVMPHWKKALGVGELTDPEVSIHAGVQILAYYQQLYRDEALIVSAYGRGPVDAAPVTSGNAPGGDAEKVLATWQRLRDVDVAGRP